MSTMAVSPDTGRHAVAAAVDADAALATLGAAVADVTDPAPRA